MSYLSILCRPSPLLQNILGLFNFGKNLSLLFVCCVSLVSAEHTEQRNQVYNAKSQLSTENLNKAVELLRNPTIMSGNFRQALQSLTPTVSSAFAATTSPEVDDDEDMPFITLAGKVIAKDHQSSVVLKINNHSVHLSEGDTSSQMINRKIVNIRVDKITTDAVTIFLSPFNQSMVLK